MSDKIKLSVAMLLVAAAVVAFYYFEDQSLLLRVVALLAVIGMSVAIAMQAEAGRTSWAFVREARTEIRKVVWPTRKETMQTTLIVFVMVIIVGIFLWLVDMFLLWAVKLLTGQGG